MHRMMESIRTAGGGAINPNRVMGFKDGNKVGCTEERKSQTVDKELSKPKWREEKVGGSKCASLLVAGKYSAAIARREKKPG